MARAEAKLVWIMPSRDRARRSQACLNIAEVRTDGAASAEAKLVWTMASRDRGRQSQGGRRTQTQTRLDYAESCADGAASGEAELAQTIPSRHGGRQKSQRKTKSGRPPFEQNVCIPHYRTPLLKHSGNRRDRHNACLPDT